MKHGHAFQDVTDDRVPRGRIGTWVKIPSVVTMEIINQSSFDFVVIDLEHSAISLEWVHTACAVSQGSGTSVLVRMPDASAREIQRVLDLGVDGLVIPQLRDAAQVETIMAAATFPPRGLRGAGPSSRAGRWGAAALDEYMEAGDLNTIRCIQFETKESFIDAERMIDVPGVNAVLFGPMDLSVALGVRPGSSELDEYAVRLIELAGDRSIPCGTAVANPGQARHAMSLGFQYVTVGSDVTSFASAMDGLARASRSVVGEIGASISGRFHGDRADATPTATHEIGG